MYNFGHSVQDILYRIQFSVHFIVYVLVLVEYMDRVAVRKCTVTSSDSEYQKPQHFQINIVIMSSRQIHPILESDVNDFQIGLQTLQFFQEVRQTRNQTREATTVLSPKNYPYFAVNSPKPSHFQSQAFIIEDDVDQVLQPSSRFKFQRAVKKLAIILQFYRTIKYGVRDQISKSMIRIANRRQLLPFYPDNRYIVLWNHWMKLIMFLSVALYPPYLAIQNEDWDGLSTLIFIIDLFNLFDIVLHLLTCKIDRNHNLITSFTSIFLFYLSGWMIPDILSILPYNLLLPRKSQDFSVQDYLNLLKLLKVIKYFTYIERSHFRRSHDQEPENINLEAPFWDYVHLIDGKILSIFMIFKNMLILINVFGCLWFLVARYEGIADGEFSSSEYITNLYWGIQTVTVVGYGDIVASTSMQYNLIIIWIFVGVGFYSFTIGNLAQILEENSQDDSMEYDLEKVDELFSQMIIPEELQNSVFGYFYYNLDTNPFWNYRRIIEKLPLHLKTYTIAFCQQNLIKNIHMFSFNIGFACSLLPNLTIYDYKQYETIYFIGSPSLDIYFLLTGEVRLCDTEGNTLLNIMEGHTFGEMEILDAAPRQHHAIASMNSIVVICPIQLFVEKIQQNDELFFEIEQLALRRKVLLKESVGRQKQNHRLRRKSALKGQRKSEISPFLEKKINLERTFKQEIIKDSFQELQQKLLQFVFGKKTEKKWKLKAIFRMSVRKIIDTQRAKIASSKQIRRKSTLFNRRMIKNFEFVVNQEKKIKKRLDRNRKKNDQRLKVAQILGGRSLQAGCMEYVKQSQYSQDIYNESQQQKQLKKQREEEQQQYSQRLMKIDLRGQLRIVDSQLSTLVTEVFKMKVERAETKTEQSSFEELILDIQRVVSQIL